MSDSTHVEQTPATIVTPPGRWLHRWAMLIVVMVWPLIWIGGLVTTYDAGMAVPDWPGTYGYNLFLYPYQTWLLGPFDLFIEHGHRLLAALVGFVAIIAVAVAFATEPRRWVRWFALAILVLIIAQGGLGGARVLLAERTLAMVHGCIAQAFFAFSVGLVVVTSRWWWMPSTVAGSYRPGRGLIAAVAALVGLSYLQVLLGAQLRHVQVTTSPTGFSHLVTTHIVTAAAVFALAVTVAWRLCCARHSESNIHPDAGKAAAVRSKKQGGCGDLALSGPALLLLTFVAMQISLGLATWIARYGMPSFAQVGPWTASYLVKSQAFTESLIITGHVAIGAMVLVTSAYLLLRVGRARYSYPTAESH